MGRLCFAFYRELKEIVKLLCTEHKFSSVMSLGYLCVFNKG